MQHVFVLDAHQRPLMPCRPARARLLLAQGKAAVLRRYPFTIVLHAAQPEAAVAPLRVKIDPGSRATGIDLMSDNDTTGEILWAAEVAHRGQAVHEALVQ